VTRNVECRFARLAALSGDQAALLRWTILESLGPVAQRVEPECRRSSDPAVSGVAAETLPIRHEEQSPPDGDTEREMSEENVELVHAVYDRLNVGGAEAVRKLLDPDVVFKEPPEQPGATAFHGMDAAIEGFGKWSENWEMHRIEPERLIDLGDRVLSLEHHRLRGRDGVEVEADSATIWTLRRGKVIRVEAWWDQGTALKIAELE
jgi:ketosteroid isomerase-like protein